MSKLIAILFLAFVSAEEADAGTDDPRWLNGEMVRVATCDPRVTSIRYLKWGNRDASGIVSEVCPPRKIWLIRVAGIGSDMGGGKEYSMAVFLTNPFGTAGWWLIPLHRPTGVPNGTPTLAIERELILMPGEGLCARVNSVLREGATDNTQTENLQMNLMFVGFELSEDMLPYLLGLPKSESSMTAQELAIEQLIK